MRGFSETKEERTLRGINFEGNLRLSSDFSRGKRNRKTCEKSRKTLKFKRGSLENFQIFSATFEVEESFIKSYLVPTTKTFGPIGSRVAISFASFTQSTLKST